MQVSIPRPGFAQILPISSGIEVADPDLDEWRPVCLKTNQGPPQPHKGEVMIKLYLNLGMVTAMLLTASIARADSLELKN
jgi:hypothetical protein